MAWLLDTNILSELRRPKPEAKVLAFIETLPLDEIYVSVVTLAELALASRSQPTLHDGRI